MSSIDGLFEQIYHYEKTAQERKNFLQELRQAVFSAQEKGKALKNGYTDLKNKLAQKICELSDKELICKWLSSQETVFKEQQADLEKQLEELTEEQECVLKKLQDEKEKFCVKISDFTTQFGPRNCGSVQRESSYTSQLAALLKERDQLVSGLEKVSVREEAVSNLCKEKEKLQRQLDKVTCENKKLTSSLCEELEMSSVLEGKRQSVSNIPNTDPEFTCVQEQLGAERQISVELEDKYGKLQSQLHQLHQKLWQQQLKQQQKLSNQQQSGYKQQQFIQQTSTHESEGSQPLFTASSVAWQQCGSIQTAGRWMEQQRSKVYGQKHNSQGQKTQSVEGNNLTNKVTVSNSSQQNTKMDSCLEDCSDVLFSDSDDLSVDNQQSREQTDD